MSDTIQYIIVGLILAACLFFIGRRLWLRHKRRRCSDRQSACSSCDADCPLK